MKYSGRIVNDKDYKMITGKIKMTTTLPAQNVINTSYQWSTYTAHMIL